MSENKIKAGEAFITVSCDNTELLKGLQEISKRIDAAARDVSLKEKSLSPNVSIDVKPATRALEEIEKAVSRASDVAKRNWEKVFAVTAGDVVNGFTKGIKTLSSMLGETGDAFNKMAGRVGASSAVLSEYAHAAQMCGADIGAVEQAFKGMATAINNAKKGSADAVAKFSLVGVSLSDLQGLTPDEQFEKLAGAVASLSDPTARAAAAMEIFGDSGQALLPLFAEGSDGIAALRKEARTLGVSMDDATAKMGADYVDALTRAKSSTKGLALTLAANCAPAVTGLLNAFAKIVSGVGSFVRKNQALILTLAPAVAGLTGAATAGKLYAMAMIQVSKAVNFAKSALIALNATTTKATALTGALAALAVAYYAVKEAREAAFPDKVSNDAADAYDSGNAARQTDAADIQTLEDLRKKQQLQKLTNEELLNAASIVARLRAKYGEVGYAVDSVTGKITAATDAQQKLNEKMTAAKKKELEAAIQEKKNNLEGNNLEKSMARDEVTETEKLLGKKRGESWGHYLTHYEKKDEDPGGYALQIVGGDKDFQKKVAAARDKERAALEVLQAQLDAMNGIETAAASSSSSGFAFNLTQSDVQSGFDQTESFINQGVDSLKNDVQKQCDAIDEQAARLVKSLEKLVDPEGEINFDDSATLERLKKENPAFAELLDRRAAVYDSAEMQKQQVKAAALEKEDVAILLESTARIPPRWTEYSGKRSGATCSTSR